VDNDTKFDFAQVKAVAVVRQQICKWQRNDKTPNHSAIQHLKENVDFEVKSSATEDTQDT